MRPSIALNISVANTMAVTRAESSLRQRHVNANETMRSHGWLHALVLEQNELFMEIGPSALQAKARETYHRRSQQPTCFKFQSWSLGAMMGAYDCDYAACSHRAPLLTIFATFGPDL